MINLNQILTVATNQTDRLFIKKCLNDEYHILEASNSEEAISLLDRYYETIGVIILDIIIPMSNDYKLIRKLHDEVSRNIPIVVLVQNNNIKNHVDLLDFQVCDIFEKTIEPKILKNRIENIILKTQLEFFYTYDELTKIYNERTFYSKVHDILMKDRSNTYVLIRFDIEQFKIINDLFGRTEGDKLLKYIALILREIIGDNGIFARFSTDIFAICIKHNKEQNEKIINFINNRIKNYPLQFEIILCFGLYVVENPDTPVYHMLDLANLAAKTVKENYVKRFAYYDEGLRDSLINKYEIINDMNMALEENQFDIFLQPKYNLKTNKIEGSEALVRWFHPKKGMISPGEFIPIFERNGFILKLDSYVLEKTCKTIRKWLDIGLKVVPISVNLSRINLYNPNLFNSIVEIVNKYNIPKELIQLEITESAYNKNAKQLIELMNDLQNEGFKILMDDFGSGYSSLNMLKDIPVDILKIDLRFLSDCNNQIRSNTILKSVVIMAKDLDIPTIAEGVETKEQADFLLDIGCNSIQGYYYSKPLPVLDYERLIKNNS